MFVSRDANAHDPQVYMPQPEYSNGDFLVYSVFDGVQESAEARFDFKFFAKDNLPITTAVAARVDEDSVLGVRIQLNGSDVDSADPTFVITELPQKGKLFTVDGEPIEAAFTGVQVAGRKQRSCVHAVMC
jgi:hypothetical protein